MTNIRRRTVESIPMASPLGSARSSASAQDCSRRGLLLGSIGLAAATLVLGSAPALAAEFSDVPEGHPFAREIRWMREQGITTGYPDGSFRPNAPILRDAFAAFLFRLVGGAGFTAPTTSPFTDVPMENQFYTEICWARAKGFVNGWPDGTFRPLQPVSRDAAVAIFHRVAGRPAVPSYAPYTDVPGGAQFRDEIGWARSVGLMTGWADGSFRPLAPMAREAMAALFYRHVNGGIFGKNMQVVGGIAQAYWAVGGPGSPLGTPISAETDVRSGASGAAGRVQSFEGGRIYWGPGTGAFPVYGALRWEHEGAGGAGGALGFPRTGEVRYGAGVRQDYEGGFRTWYPGWNPPENVHGPVVGITPVRGGVTLRRGWNGTRVRIIQKKLGISRLGSAQTYDAATEQAVRDFQRRHGLSADGIVGPATWARLAPEYPFDMDAWQTAVKVAPDASRSQRIEEMIRYARSCLGSPYTWGGAGWRNHSVAGYDCSGLVIQSLYSAGLDPQPINVVAHAEPSYRSSQMLYADRRMQSLDLSQRARGDLIFYADSGQIVRHVVIYLGNEQIIEAYNSSEYGRDTHVRPYARNLSNVYLARPVIKRPFV